MTSSSVHPRSVRPINQHNLLTTTPALIKKQNLNLHRTLQKTAVSKPREFNIYVDNRSSSSSALDQINNRSRKEKNGVTTEKSLVQAKQSIDTRLGVSPTKKTNQKPLEDKTNTVRKKVSRVRINEKQEHSPTNHKSVKTTKNNITQSTLNEPSSQSPILLTPHSNNLLETKKSPCTHQLSALQEDPTKRFFYRTPVTSKRAARPPVANTSGNIENDDGEAVFDDSHDSSNLLHFDLNQKDIPDVEYGPPSAIVEPVECLIEEQGNGINELDMVQFYKHLKQDPSNYMISDHDGWLYNDSIGRMSTEIEEIISSDGSKDKWNYEPRCEVTNYSVDMLLDELLIPSGFDRQLEKTVRARSSRQQLMSMSSLSSRFEVTPSNSRSHLRGTTKPSTLVRSQSNVRLPPTSTRHSKNLAKASCSFTAQATEQTPCIPTSLTEYKQLVKTLIRDHRSKFQSELDQLHSHPDDSSDHFAQDLNSFQFELIV